MGKLSNDPNKAKTAAANAQKSDMIQRLIEAFSK